MKISKMSEPTYENDGKVTTCLIEYDSNKIKDVVRTGTKKNFLTDFSKIKTLKSMLVGRGRATCSENDTFSEYTGQKIALQRAKIDLISKIKSYYKLEIDAIGAQAETINDIMDFLQDEQERYREIITKENNK